jgi:hypothetical protein
MALESCEIGLETARFAPAARRIFSASGKAAASCRIVNPGARWYVRSALALTRAEASSYFEMSYDHAYFSAVSVAIFAHSQRRFGS